METVAELFTESLKKDAIGSEMPIRDNDTMTERICNCVLMSVTSEPFDHELGYNQVVNELETRI